MGAPPTSSKSAKKGVSPGRGTISENSSGKNSPTCFFRVRQPPRSSVDEIPVLDYLNRAVGTFYRAQNASSLEGRYTAVSSYRIAPAL